MPDQTLIDSKVSISDKNFDIIADFMLQNTGIVLKQEKKVMVQSRLKKRMATLSMNDDQYCAHITSSAGNTERKELINALTTNLTSFFRENHHFEHLKNVVMKEKERKAASERGERFRFRLWSAGCSTGEEVYSIAMTIKESGAPIQNWDFKILATDIDTDVLNTARKGQYYTSKGIPQDYLQKYCQVTADGAITMKQDVKNLIVFNQLNLMDTWPIKNQFDVIFCRNTVIYFDKETQKVLFERFANLLPMGGWLYIGHSESLYQVCDRFQLVSDTLYQKVK